MTDASEPQRRWWLAGAW